MEAMFLKACRRCGAPRIVRLVRGWNPDWTSTTRFSDSGMRLCDIHCDELASFISGAGDRLAVPVEELMMAAQRKAARSSMDDALAAIHGLTGSWARSRLIGNRSAIRAICETGAGLGHGAIRVQAGKKGEMISFSVSNPSSAPLLVGALWGAFEALNNVTADAVWDDQGDILLVTIRRLHDGLVWEDPSRFPLVKTPEVGAEVECERCDLCGIPSDYTREVEWDVGRGTVTSRSTGARLVTIVAQVVNAVIDELTGEIGDSVPAILCETAQEYTAGVLHGVELPNTVREYRMLLDEIRVMGMGNPADVRKEGEALTVRIDGPFCEPILAGKVAGYYQVLEHAMPRVSWAPAGQNSTVVQAWPA